MLIQTLDEMYKERTEVQEKIVEYRVQGKALDAHMTDLLDRYFALTTEIEYLLND